MSRNITDVYENATREERRKALRACALSLDQNEDEDSDQDE